MNLLFKSLLFALLGGSAVGLAQQARSSGPAQGLESVVAQARQAQAAGNYAAAAGEWKKAVELGPDYPELWANLGLMQQETGNTSAAIDSFTHAHRLNPALYVPNLFLGIDYAHSGQALKAIPFLVSAGKLNKSDPQAPLALGRAYFAAGKYALAAAALDRATTLDPKLGSAWFTLGIARLEQVEADARAMSEEGKQSPFSAALYADSLVRQSRYAEAADTYKSLLNSLPQPPCIRSGLGFALMREHDLQGAAAAFASERALHPECGRALLGEARLALDAADNDRALTLLRQLWERDHGFVAANALLLLDGLSDDKAAATVDILASQDAAAMPPELRDTLLAAFHPSGAESVTPLESADASGRSAGQLYSAGRFRQCALSLESAPAPLSAEKLRLLAACALYTGDNQHAARAADALRGLEPRSFEAVYWSIQANERLASQSLARFQQLDPDSVRSHVLLADVYRQLERFNEAQAECEKALAIAPDDPAARLDLAWVYLYNHNHDGAMAIARQELARSPNDPELNLIVAEVLMDQREYAAAEPYLLKSLNAKPQMLPRIHALLGKTYAETGRTKEAIEQLKLGEASDEDGSAQYLLARLYRQMGDTRDAQIALDRMKLIKQQREARGIKRVEDPDLSRVETAASPGSTP